MATGRAIGTAPRHDRHFHAGAVASLLAAILSSIPLIATWGRSGRDRYSLGSSQRTGKIGATIRRYAPVSAPCLGR